MHASNQALRGRRVNNALVATTPLAYHEFASPDAEAADLDILGRLAAATPTAVQALVSPGAHFGTRLTLKRYALGGPLALQPALQVLDRFGLALADYRVFSFDVERDQMRDQSGEMRPEARGEARGGQRGEQPGAPGERHLQVFVVDLPAPAIGGLDAMPADASAAGVGLVGQAVRRLVTTLPTLLDAVWEGRDEADAYSRLITVAGLAAREVAVLRAYAAYLRQIGHPQGDEQVAGALVRHPAATRALIDCFQARFDPARQGEGGATEVTATTARPGLADGSSVASELASHAASTTPAADLSIATPTAMTAATARLDAALQAIAGDEDLRVFRLLRGLIAATLRTNVHGRDSAGQPLPAIAFKFDGRAVEGSPAPTPLYEIFVHSPRVEGIHLRGGKVSRGGIRWSDRAADYRTEVHGLFKAQMVKNVVIVPEGAKGGFVLRRPPSAGASAGAGAGAGAALREEAIACYKIFIGSLLDLTDNWLDGRVVPPAGVVRHDGDDPYLVVAADKGTATFSDIANAIAVDRGFWLGDAFASGGSAGYDHKALAITARGTWEAVKRHFRELGVDAERESITVTGVGDMSGDVFGNGLLLSPRMRLIGAFDHRHIFVDPEPDLERAHAERRRLFALPASSWDDFDRAALGEGGAIFRRDAPQIELSIAAQQRFGLSATTTPAALMRAILRADVDLLWLGGIGTYVRAGDETDAEVGDRANDALRVTGGELRCKVVGEGANLGCTQRGRIEYAQAGGRIDTDAIHNAGGVSCSDHEVNIKILFAGLEAAGAGPGLPRAQRDALLSAMSDEVCALVIRDVARQTEALSIACARAPQDLGRHARLLRFFERNGQLDRGFGRRLAGLPEDEAIAGRRAAGQGLTRPELAVLLAHTKIALFAEFIASDLPDEALLEDDLMAYFPQLVRDGFADAVRRHPLRREIVTTALVNSMVDRVGSGFVNDLQERTGETDAEIARAYLAARRLFGMEALWADIARLDTAQDSARHLRLMQESREIVENATLWLLRGANRAGVRLDLSATVERHAGPLAELLAELQEGTGGSGDFADRLSRRLDLLLTASRRLDVLSLAERRRCGVVTAARMLFATDEVLDLPALADAIRASAGRSESDALAAGELQHAAASAALTIAERCLGADERNPGRSAGQNAGPGVVPGTMLPDYLAPRRALLARYHAWHAEVRRCAGGGLAPVVLAVEALRGIAA